MTRPRLLDLFCGAGGAAMGYHRAGFDVVGVDINPQPHYPFEFHQGDAMTWACLHGFDAYHASPPCQFYANVTGWRGDRAKHPNLIPEMIGRLQATERAWVIENVPEAAPPLRVDLMLCGSMFGLRVKRHRIFMSNVPLFTLLNPCRHGRDLLPFMHKGERAYADELGCTWMTNREAREAIPPAYTEHIGRQLMAYVEAAA